MIKRLNFVDYTKDFSILSYGDITCMGVQAVDSEEIHPITKRKRKGKDQIEPP